MKHPGEIIPGDYAEWHGADPWAGTVEDSHPIASTDTHTTTTYLVLLEGGDRHVVPADAELTVITGWRGTP